MKTEHDVRLDWMRVLKKYTGGDHGGPVVYGIVIEGGQGWLMNFGSPDSVLRLIRDRPLQLNLGDESPRQPSLGDCAEVLWLEGAHPESMLMVWHGPPTGDNRGKVVMLGTAVLAMADCIVRADDEAEGSGRPIPEFFSEYK
jgi:hypothetical protein